ncbi:MAG: TetR/AcrR family transcriptional regulator [Clostridiales bacterium]|nr:TetR/AcrR family transcriptional regulator [Clostridiales bacterium]
MKQVREYSEKEKSIFKGIMDLLNQGCGIHELKVSDIALAAGIGKGTVYEYFSTKEEIIREAVSYYVYKEFDTFTALIDKQQNFTDTIYDILNHTIEMLKTRFTSLLFMVVSLEESDVKQLIQEDRTLLPTVRSGMNEFIEKLCDKGRKEKLIGEDVSFEECKLVLNGILTSFTNEVLFMRNKSLPGTIQDSDSLPSRVDILAEPFIDEEGLSELKDRVVKLILKALK